MKQATAPATQKIRGDALNMCRKACLTFIILFITLLILLTPTHCSKVVGYAPTPIVNYDKQPLDQKEQPEYRESPLKESKSGGSISVYQSTALEGPHLLITKEFTDTQTDKRFIGNPATILVRIINNGDRIKNIRIWELLDSDLAIQSCSYPLKTHDINESLKYEINSLSTFGLGDFRNIKRLAEKLTTAEDNISLSIRKGLSKRALEIMSNSSAREEEIESALINELNEVVMGNPTIYDKDLFKAVILSSDTKKLLYAANLQSEDIKLLNRKLIEDAYPKEITKTFSRPHEKYSVDRSLNRIYLYIDGLGKGETLTYKYCIIPNETGHFKIDTIIKNGSSYDIQSLPLDVLAKDPSFDVKLHIPEKELIENILYNISYGIKYLGGSEEVLACKISIPNKTESYCIKEYQHDLSFIENEEQKIDLSITFNKTGLKSLPILEIGPKNISTGYFNRQYYPSQEIRIYSNFDHFATEHFNFFSIALTFVLALLSIGSIFGSFYTRKQANLMKEDLDLKRSQMILNQRQLESEIRNLKNINNVKVEDDEYNEM